MIPEVLENRIRQAFPELKAFLKVAHLDAQYREITLQCGSNANWLKIRHFHFYKKPFELVGVLIVLIAQKLFFFHFFNFFPFFSLHLLRWLTAVLIGDMEPIWDFLKKRVFVL